MRRRERRRPAGGGDWLAEGVVHLLGGEDAALAELVEDPVAGGVGGGGIDRRVEAAGRARQGYEQGDLARRELPRLLAEVEPGGGADPLEVAAVGGEVEVGGE